MNVALARTGDAELPRLNRQLRPTAMPPVRIVHLGLGAFHRSHQAWYTHQASDADQWGIAAFTGRRPDAARVLAEQDGLYTMVERADSGDSFTTVASIVEAVDGADTSRLEQLVAAPATAIVTLTITEAAYASASAGPINRLVVALASRRTAGAGPMAIVSCDNLANNGDVTRHAVMDLANALDPGLSVWIAENVSFVSTSVDRITPRTTTADLELVAGACGYRDSSPVVAEPFSNWVLSGDFPVGRPRWEDAGAVFVDDIEPFENRKLWLLNGAHSLLAYAGTLRGHATVAEALADPVCREAVEQFWNEAEANLPDVDLDIPGYRATLLARFGNSRIAHHLGQIALDGTTKLRMRALPVLHAERSAGRSGRAAALMIAAWMDFTISAHDQQDPLIESIETANLLSGSKRTRALLSLLDPALATDNTAVELIENLRGTFRPCDPVVEPVETRLPQTSP